MRRLASLVMPALVACAPAPAGPTAPVSRPVPGDMSQRTGPEPPPEVAATPVPEAAPVAPTATPASALAPVKLGADAGLQVVLDRRGWDFAAAPGLVLVLGDDFKQLEARQAEAGAHESTATCPGRRPARRSEPIAARHERALAMPRRPGPPTREAGSSDAAHAFSAAWS